MDKPGSNCLPGMRKGLRFCQVEREDEKHNAYGNLQGKQQQQMEMLKKLMQEKPELMELMNRPDFMNSPEG